MYFEAKYLGINISIDTDVEQIVVKDNGHSDKFVNTVIKAVVRQFKNDKLNNYTIKRI